MLYSSKGPASPCYTALKASPLSSQGQYTPAARMSLGMPSTGWPHQAMAATAAWCALCTLHAWKIAAVHHCQHWQELASYFSRRAHKQNCLHTASTTCSHAPPMLQIEEESLVHKNMTVRKDNQRRTAKRDNHSGTKPQDDTPCSTLDWGACQHREWGNGPKP